MIRWENMKRLTVPSDITMSAIEEVANSFKELNDSPQTIVCAQSQYSEATFCAKEIGLAMLCLPDGVIEQDAWCVLGERNIVWSPGA